METEPKPRVSKITVGRLFNLGSYEHIRYELTVEIPEGASATQAIVGVERIFEALNPSRLKVCKTEMELRSAEARLAEEALMTDEDFNRRHGHSYVGTRDEYTGRMRKSLLEDKAKREIVLTRAKRARELFDDLGGASQYKDAKLDWDLSEDDGY